MPKWESKVLKAGDKLLVEIPPDVLERKRLKRGDTVLFVEDMQGRVELLNKSMLESNKCVLCNKREHRNTCISCGRKVCSNCYFNMAGICHACGSFKDKKKKY